ncbi:uncharacterized protein LOC126377181 [Pectinophora gossypiella]|uniref:uncharacterized protein LOC126368971 n=1 Tax=Pectinophora gossypiella TaxID=13191 RepID=UPI00214EDEFF|nr:uncharacterized protein LOC126368971 [Pectinophora gossypiella]XP_049880832.1 uncharacterized protein LOC126377181 [Pectinophora gossypiella]
MTNFIGNISNFDHNVQEWQIFYGRFEQFVKINNINDGNRGALLLTLLSDDTYRLARNLVHPDKLEDVKFDELVKKLSSHFTPKRSVFADRANFYAATRGTGESVEDWVARLRGLIVHCEFGSALESHLLDRFVLGMNAGPERDRLFELDATTCTFAKAVEVAQQMSCARLARAQPGAGAAGLNVKEEPVYRVSGAKGDVDRSKGVHRCSVCGLKNHDAAKCRFKNYRCQVCGEIGHLKKVCSGKKSINSRIHNINSVPENSEKSECDNCKECQVFNLRFPN